MDLRWSCVGLQTMDSKQCNLILKQVVVMMTMVRCMASVIELCYASQEVGVVGCEQCSHPTTQRPTTATNHIQQNQNNTPNAVTGPLFS